MNLLCDRCRVSGCCLDYLSKACKMARKQHCPDVVYTRSDHIRDMDDECLAVYLEDFGRCPPGDYGDCHNPGPGECVKCWLRFLQLRYEKE